MEACGRMIEEDCIYDGDVVMDVPDGSISDPLHCQGLCHEFEEMGCQYWIYNKVFRGCSLRTSSKKSCSIQSGPEVPPIADCQGHIAFFNLPYVLSRVCNNGTNLS